MHRYWLVLGLIAGCSGEVPHTEDVNRADSNDVDADVGDADLGVVDSGPAEDLWPDADVEADPVEETLDVEPERPTVEPSLALPVRPPDTRCLPSVSSDEFTMPDSILDTGCYAADGTPTHELVPYDVNAPLWTDGAAKYRYIAVPVGEQIRASAGAPWEFPTGSVLLKTFSFEFEDSDGVQERPVETRFMVMREFGWQFFTYGWNEDASDAFLVSDQTFRPLETVAGPVEYLYPDEESCRYCHSGTAELVLGPRTGQLDRIVEYADGWANQIEVFEAIDLLAANEEEAEVWPDPRDEEFPVEDRARSYLAANCAHCHQPGGWQPPPMTLDLRFELPLEDTQLCDAIQYISPLVPGLDRIVPGQPEESNVYNRIVHQGLGSMPPLAVSIVDEVGAAVVEEWIREMESCP